MLQGVMFVVLCAFSCLHFAGTVITPDPYQIFSKSSTINKFIAIGGGDITVIITDDSPVIAIDYHYQLNAIFWVSDNSIRTAPLDTVDGVATDYPPLVTGTQITSISVDWRANKLYWTDSAAHTIEQYDIVSNQRTIIYQTVADGAALGIVVDPFTGWVYWTDGLKGTVERIHVNGTTHRIIRQQKSRISCTNSVSWPIALNYSSQYLYWSDSCVNELERVTVGGYNSLTVYPGQLLSFASSITSYKSTLWWSQPRSLYKIDMNGTGLTQIYGTGSLSKLYSVRTVHPDNQPNDLQVPDCNPSCVHGFCADPVANVCDCLGTGWTGPLCNIDVVECNGTIALCGDNQKCVNTNGSYMCLNSTSQAMPMPSTITRESLINTALHGAVPGLSQSYSVTRSMATTSGVTLSVFHSASTFKPVTTTSPPKTIILTPRPTTIPSMIVRTTVTNYIINTIFTATLNIPSGTRSIHSPLVPTVSMPSVPMTTITTPTRLVSVTPLSSITVGSALEPLNSPTTALPESSRLTSSPSMLGPIKTSMLGPITSSTIGPITSSTLGPITSSTLGPITSSALLTLSTSSELSELDVPVSTPAMLYSMTRESSSIVGAVGTLSISRSASVNYLSTSGIQLSPSKTHLPVVTLMSLTSPDPAITPADDASPTRIPQLPIKPADENAPKLPTYALIATIFMGVLLLAAIAALVAATLYCRHNRMKYAEQEGAFSDLSPSNKVVNNPLYIGIHTLECIAEHNEKERSARSSILMRDDLSIAQCSSSGSEASARSDEPMVPSAV